MPNQETEERPAPPDAILVEDLRVQAFVGVLAFERSKRQTLRFDVEIETVPDYARIVRETGRYVSYADTVTYVIDRAATDEHVDLVETWAEDVAAQALDNPLAAAATVRVLKLDIFGEAHGVGVRIHRRSNSKEIAS